jgi:formate-dependent nitrite reductase membrane component NrfD
MSLFLIALGAILRYAINASLSGIDLQVVGLILMIVGIIGLVITLFVMFMHRDSVDYDERPTRRY